MRPRQDYSRSRQKDYNQSNYRNYNIYQQPTTPISYLNLPSTNSNPNNNFNNLINDDKDKDKNPSNIPNIIYLYNIPQNFNKQDIAYFIYKNLQLLKGVLKKAINPILRTQYLGEKKCIMIQFKTREQALNCLELNGIYYGNRAFYMKSQLIPRQYPRLITNNIRIRKVSNKVQEGFNKIFIGNLPQMEQYEVLDMLSLIGELKSLEKIDNKLQIQYFCQFKNNQKIDEYLVKLNELKIKNRSIIAKRSALMNTSDTSKSKIIKSRRSLFQKDLNSFYLTLDTEGYFKNMKISCILLLKNIISNLHIKNQILKDIRKQVQKIGPIIKLISYERNVYIQFERVQYAQIGYLIISQRKYDNKSIDVSFYDPVQFADEIYV